MMEEGGLFLRSHAQFKLKAGKWRFPKSLTFNPAVSKKFHRILLGGHIKLLAAPTSMLQISIVNLLSIQPAAIVVDGGFILRD